MEWNISSLHSVIPGQGYLEAVLHIMGYLKLRHISRLMFDPSYPDIDHSNFQECDWTHFFEGAVEAIPPNSPLPKGKEVDLCMFIDSDHADNKLIGRSRTRSMIYVNMSLINWHSKKQSTIETSVFGIEFVAMNIRVETLCVIQYKLRIMSIPISGASYVYGDNMLVIHNASEPESTLKKKYNAIAYYAQ